ncbi:glycosyltransferase family 4 protein [Marinobacter sp.]|uniref:glycosyltransferase family 4 protein n=1 Tax=Marinobacter sp. TaxID=50741 RepID=UPI003561B367
MTKQFTVRPISVTQIISGDLWAGAEVQVYNLCKALHTSPDIKVTAVVFNLGILNDRLVELGIPVTLADETATGPLGIIKAIASHCRTQDTDLIHTHGFKENILGILGKELGGVHYSIRTVHGNPEHKFSWKKPHKWLASRVDIGLGRIRQQAVIAVSTQLQMALEPQFPGMVHKICNFIDVQELRDAWLPKPSKTSPEIKVGIVGRLVPVKRIDLFITAIHLLNKEGIYCKGVIIGDGPLRSELERLASNLGVKDHIDFLGFIDPAAEEMSTLDVLLMTSDHEGLPMTLLEAMALSVPIVAHKTGGIPELLNDGDCGSLVTDHTSSGYASAVKELLRGNLKHRLVENAFLQVKRSFSSEHNTADYIHLYKKTVSKEVSPSR